MKILLIISLTSLALLGILAGCSSNIPTIQSADNSTPITSPESISNANNIVVSGLLVSYSVDELVRKSDSIVIGKVVNVSSAMDSNTFLHSLTADQIKMGVGVPFSVYRDVTIQPTNYLYGHSAVQIS